MKRVKMSAMEAFRLNLQSFFNDPEQPTITQVAEELQTSRPFLSRLINGHSEVSIQMAERIAGAIGVPLVTLLEKPSRKSR